MEDIRAKILELIKGFSAPKQLMWKGPERDYETYSSGYEDGYKVGYDDAAAEILRAVDEMEVCDDA